MGGVGSGYCIKKVNRQYLDDLLSMDINFINRHHALMIDTEFSLSWGDTENVIASMAITVKEEYLEILHNQKTAKGYGGPCEADIGLTYTQCHYGYKRPWFLCPDCGGRAAKLYHLESGFICRKCSGLPYQSQSESGFDRSIRKARKIRLKLGVDANLLNPFFMKSEGMYWKTLYRLYKKLEQVEQECFSKLG